MGFFPTMFREIMQLFTTHSIQTYIRIYIYLFFKPQPGKVMAWFRWGCVEFWLNLGWDVNVVVLYYRLVQNICCCAAFYLCVCFCHSQFSSVFPFRILLEKLRAMETTNQLFQCIIRPGDVAHSANHEPHAPCMVYLPTFGLNLW